MPAHFFQTSLICSSVSSCVTLMHPAKAVGQNKMPFGRDTHVAPSNPVLDGGPGPPAVR